jgi:hypothetical protein
VTREKPPLLGKVVLGKIQPANGAAEDALRALAGQEVRFEIKRSGANQRRRGFYWVALDVAADALSDRTGFKWDAELLHYECKRRLRFGDFYQTPSGHEVFKPWSTSNRALPENERARFTDRVVGLLSAWLEVEITDLMNEARERNGGKGPEGT